MAGSNKINLKAIVKISGLLMVIEGLFMLTSLGFSAWYDPYSLSRLSLFNPTHDFLPLLLSGSGIAISGYLLWFWNRSPIQNSIGKREGYIIATLSWIIISALGAIPFMLSGVTHSYTDAFFETISGFTTTGATIFNDVEAIPKGLLFWRALTQWIGGMIIIILSLAIMPILGIGGMQQFAVEASGFSAEKLHPRLIDTMKRFGLIYLILTFSLALLLFIGGQNFFDSLCHAFSTLSTGGFSTKNNSISEFSEFSRYVIAFFMLIAGISYSVQYYTFSGQWKRAIANEEIRYYFSLVLFCIIICTAALFFLVHNSFRLSIGESVFQVISIISTTGFVTTDYQLWPSFLWMLTFLLMFVGACTGSTGGGVKIIRILLLLKNSTHELKRLVHPQAIIPVKLNGKHVGQETIFNVLAFFLIYIMVFAAGSLIMSIIGMDFYTAIGSTAACIGNIGPGLGSTGPMLSYATIPEPGKWFLAFLMLIGRLEFLTVFILFSGSFWKK